MFSPSAFSSGDLILQPANDTEASGAILHQECAALLENEIAAKTAAYNLFVREIHAASGRIGQVYQNRSLGLSAEEYFAALRSIHRFVIEAQDLMSRDSHWRRVVVGYQPAQAAFIPGLRKAAWVFFSLVAIARQNRVETVDETQFAVMRMIDRKFNQLLYQFNQMGPRQIYTARLLEIMAQEPAGAALQKAMVEYGVELSARDVMEIPTGGSLEGLRVHWEDGRLVGMISRGIYDEVVAKKGAVFVNWFHGAKSFQEDLQDLAKASGVELRSTPTKSLLGVTIGFSVSGLKSRIERFRVRLQKVHGHRFSVL